MFEKVTRLKLRFATAIGAISVEDVWDLPLVAKIKGRADLNTLAKALSKEVREAEEEDFVGTKTKGTSETQLKFDVVKYIIGVKLAEEKIALDSAKKREQRRLVADIIAQKENQQLADKSLDELRAMLNDD